MQLTYSEQSSKGGSQRILAVLCACLLGGSTFAAGCSAFGLQWNPAGAFSGAPLQGLLSVCNSIADRLGTTDYIILRKFAGGAAADGSYHPQGIFLTIALLLLCVLSYLILRSGCKWLLLVFALPGTVLLLLTGVAPGAWTALVFGFALVCAFACMQQTEGGHILLLAIPLAALIITFAAGMLIDHTAGLSQSALQKQTQTAITNQLDKRYGKNPLGKGDLERLTGESLTDLRGSSDQILQQLSAGGKDKTKTALTLTIDQKNGALQSCWLRGFVGETYRGHQWTDLGNETYYSRRDIQYWLNRNGFDGLSQLALTAQLSDPQQAGEPFACTVQTKKADCSCIYTPYEITGTSEAIPQGAQNYAGGFLRTDKLFGTKTAAYQVLPDMTGSWTDWVGRLYSTDSSPQLQNYYTSESHYNVWCYEHYTDVPEELAGTLYMAMGDPGDLTRDHADYRRAITAVRDYLDGNFIYTEKFKAPKKGEDPIERFLISGKGCDAHYAALATMLMRYYGIPARYVEGYLFTPADAAAAKAGQPYDIGFSHAHAWTEIYVDGFGWVPMEFTPGWQDVMPQADLTRGLESVNYKKQNDQQLDIPPMEEEEEPAVNYGKKLLRFLLTAGLILLLLLLAWILQKVIRRRIAYRRRMRSFADPDIRKGICAIYGSMMDEGLQLSAETVEIGERAAFSELPVEEDERTAIWKEYEWGMYEKKANEKMDRGTLPERIAAAFGRLRRK